VTWPSWEAEKRRIATALQDHALRVCPLPGIVNPDAVETLALQFVASLRREAYYRLIQGRPISAHRADPNGSSFDAERAVAYHVQCGNNDEASWLIFLMTHFAKPADSGWRRLQDVYGMLGGGVWDWATVSANPAAFTAWLAANWQRVRGKFGNHRKYESLRPDASRSMGTVVNSYVAWVGVGGHRRLFADVVHRVGNHPHTIFDALYQDLSIVSFGRLAKFDYLSMISRYGLAPIEADSAYLDGATGPTKGAHLLFDGRRDGPSTNKDLQTLIDALDRDLGVGMHVMEDALCNWQKNPLQFKHFKG
jgi:hypothetical protein